MNAFQRVFLNALAKEVDCTVGWANVGKQNLPHLTLYTCAGKVRVWLHWRDTILTFSHNRISHNNTSWFDMNDPDCLDNAAAWLKSIV